MDAPAIIDPPNLNTTPILTVSSCIEQRDRFTYFLQS